jgi:hypothetical protein
MTRPSGCPAASPSFCEHWKYATKPQDSTQRIATNKHEGAKRPQDRIQIVLRKGRPMGFALSATAQRKYR